VARGLLGGLKGLDLLKESQVERLIASRNEVVTVLKRVLDGPDSGAAGHKIRGTIKHVYFTTWSSIYGIVNRSESREFYNPQGYTVGSQSV